MLPFLVFTSFMPFFAPEPLQLEVQRGFPGWLRPTVKSQFDEFLRTSVATFDPALSLNPKLDVMPYLNSLDANYRRRDQACGFAAKIVELGDEQSRKEFGKIFADGRICTARDLEKEHPSANFEELRELREQWTVRLIEALWSQSWILWEEKYISLGNYVQKVWKIPVVQPEFRIWRSDWPDAAYSHRNKFDAQTVANVPSLRAVEQATFNWLPGQPVSNEASADLNRYALENPMRFADVFSPLTAVYSTVHWGPQDLVHVIVHELAHLQFDDLHPHFSLSHGRIAYTKDTLHDEASAEVGEWIVTQSLHGQFPEVGHLNLIKLWTFSASRQLDPHYVGFGSVFKYVTSASRLEESTASFLKKLWAASSLEQFGGKSFLRVRGSGSTLITLGQGE